MTSRSWISLAVVLLVASAASPARGQGQRLGDRLFKALDANGNGQIDRDEFSDRLPRVVEQMRRPEPSRPPHEPTPPPPPVHELEPKLNEIVERRLREFAEHHLPGLIRDAVGQSLRQRQREQWRGGPPAPASGFTAPGQRWGRPMSDRWRQHGRQRGWGYQDRRSDEPGKGAQAFMPPGRHHPAPGARPPHKKQPCFETDKPGHGPQHQQRGPDSPRRGWGRQHRRTDEPGKGAQAFTPPGRQQRGRELGKRDQDRGKLKQDWQRRRAAAAGSGGGMLFGRLDANRDRKLQSQELRRAIDVLNKVLRESGGKDITPNQWNRIAQELRHRPRDAAAEKRPGRTDRPGPKKPAHPKQQGKAGQKPQAKQPKRDQPAEKAE